MLSMAFINFGDRIIQSALQGVAIEINLMFNVWLLLPYFVQTTRTHGCGSHELFGCPRF